MSVSSVARPRPLAAVLTRASRILVSRNFGLGLALLAMLAGALTYAAVAGLLPPELATRRIFPIMLTADLMLVGLLAVVVTVRLVEAWLERRRGAAGARLHVRLVLLFSLFAVTPTFLLAIISPYFFAVLQENLLGPARAGLATASSLSEALVRGQEDAMRRDLGDVAVALQQMTPAEVTNTAQVAPILRRFADSHAMLELTVLVEPSTIVASALAVGTPVGDASVPPPETLKKAAELAQPIFFLRQGHQAVFAVMQIFTGEQLYLVTGHPVDPTFWFQHQAIEQTRTFYEARDANIANVQIAVFSVYATIALLMLLSAVSLGISIASRMTRPIGRVMAAAEQVRHGDLAVRVEEGATDDELGQLARSFNRMTDQLAAQRQDLEDAYRQLDARRQLTEAVLAGVSSGVLSVDDDGRIERVNRPALELLDVSEESLLGRQLTQVLPALDEGLSSARSRPDRSWQRQIELSRGGAARTLLVRVAARAAGAGNAGFVVTFDDVTELLSAQRMAAWGDVARRIAHEIKNPLTPIQLSAERLKRRYLRQITEDPETFTACTETIVRQVGDIGRMVDEFSSFARMPRPTLHDEDLKDICNQALFLQRNALPQIRFTSRLPDAPVAIRCDRRLIGQALTNLLKNAAEAIDGRDEPEAGSLPPGEIALSLAEDADLVRIVIEDNGRGLPKEDRARLTEPYVTTRSKGTGLGLAIVKKIMEDHGGKLVLDDREGGGARVSLVFQRNAPAVETSVDAKRAAG